MTAVCRYVGKREPPNLPLWKQVRRERGKRLEVPGKMFCIMGESIAA
jgi:hypothetical protein